MTEGNFVSVNTSSDVEYFSKRSGFTTDLKNLEILLLLDNSCILIVKVEPEAEAASLSFIHDLLQYSTFYGALNTHFNSYSTHLNVFIRLEKYNRIMVSFLNIFDLNS